MVTIEVLLFGRKFPKLQLAASPTGGTILQAHNVYSLDLSAYLKDERRDRLTWRYLWAHTLDPKGRPLLLEEASRSEFEKLPVAKRRSAWIELTTQLHNLCESSTERQFFKKCIENQLRIPKDSVWETMAIIPQVWINVISFTAENATDVIKRTRTPFRVDFLIVGRRGEHIVVEIDGPHHYETAEAAAETLAKSRNLMKAGWKHFRFHAQEVESLTGDELDSEIGAYLAVPF